jgi:2,3-bisphosphoglycerate-dependent phosphoglycerate mutase
VTASEILLIRHATPEPVAAGASEASDNDRPLSIEGRLAAEALSTWLGARPVTAVFSSPYRRAVETVQPIAAAHHLEVRILTELRERRVSDVPLEGEGFISALNRARADPAFALPGGESTDAVRERALIALDRIVRETPSGIAVAGTHGGLLSILRWHLGEEFTVDEALAEPMPSIHVVRPTRNGWAITRG